MNTMVKVCQESIMFCLLQLGGFIYTDDQIRQKPCGGLNIIFTEEKKHRLLIAHILYPLLWCTKCTLVINQISDTAPSRGEDPDEEIWASSQDAYQTPGWLAWEYLEVPQKCLDCCRRDPTQDKWLKMDGWSYTFHIGKDLQQGNVKPSWNVLQAKGESILKLLCCV